MIFYVWPFGLTKVPFGVYFFSRVLKQIQVNDFFLDCSEMTTLFSLVPSHTFFFEKEGFLSKSSYSRFARHLCTFNGSLMNAGLSPRELGVFHLEKTLGKKINMTRKTEGLGW